MKKSQVLDTCNNKSFKVVNEKERDSKSLLIVLKLKEVADY